VNIVVVSRVSRPREGRISREPVANGEIEIVSITSFRQSCRIRAQHLQRIVILARTYRMSNYLAFINGNGLCKASSYVVE
jgi:hypothetical protein